MTSKKVIQGLAMAVLIFSGVSIKAETTIPERVVRGLNYGLVGGLVYSQLCSSLWESTQEEKLKMELEGKKPMSDEAIEIFLCVWAGIGHLAAQTIISELINHFFPESGKTGKTRFAGNVAATIGAVVGVRVFNNLFGVGLGGAIGGTVADMVFEKGAEQKNDPIRQLQEMTEQNKCKREGRDKRRMQQYTNIYDSIAGQNIFHQTLRKYLSIK